MEFTGNNSKTSYNEGTRKKRERFPNFSSMEQNILIGLINKHRKILEDKRSNSSSWQQKKRTWNKILIEFESAAGVKRSAKNLRDKYENLKKSTKKDQLVTEKYINGEVSGNRRRMSLRTAAILDTSAVHHSLEDNTILEAPMNATAPAVLENSTSGSTEPVFDGPPVTVHYKNENSIDLNESIDLKTEENETIPNRNSWSECGPIQIQSHMNADKRDDDLTRAKIVFYKNNEVRAEEKHEAEMREMALKIKILETDLKIKELTYTNLSKNISI